MQNTIIIPTRPKRKFVPENLIIDSWDKIKFLFDNLVEIEISSAAELEKWMLDQSELAAVLEEDMAWRYIKMNIDTSDKELAEQFSFWIKEISPNTAPYSHKLNIKLIDNPYLKELDQEKYRIYLRSVKKQIEMIVPSVKKMQNSVQPYYISKKTNTESTQPTSKKISIKRQNTQDDIHDIIKRFKNNNNPALSLFVAKKYYELGNYHQAYNYSLITNKINKEIKVSWIIFAKSLVKLGEKDKAISILKKYIQQSNSSSAQILLDEIRTGKFQ